MIALGLAGSIAVGQGIYRWTDERGVVHFGNAPPGGKNAVEQKLPPKRAREIVEESSDDTGVEDGIPQGTDIQPASNDTEAEPDTEDSETSPTDLYDQLIEELSAPES